MSAIKTTRRETRQLIDLSGRLADMQTAAEREHGSQHRRGVLRRFAGTSDSAHEVAFWRGSSAKGGWWLPQLRRETSAVIVPIRLMSPGWAADGETMLLHYSAFAYGLQDHHSSCQSYPDGQPPQLGDGALIASLTNAKAEGPVGESEMQGYAELLLSELDILASGVWRQLAEE